MFICQGQNFILQKALGTAGTCINFKENCFEKIVVKYLQYYHREYFRVLWVELVVYI